jgi:hypothetical protein
MLPVANRTTNSANRTTIALEAFWQQISTLHCDFAFIFPSFLVPNVRCGRDASNWTTIVLALFSCHGTGGGTDSLLPTTAHGAKCSCCSFVNKKITALPDGTTVAAGSPRCPDLACTASGCSVAAAAQLLPWAICRVLFGLDDTRHPHFIIDTIHIAQLGLFNRLLQLLGQQW